MPNSFKIYNSLTRQKEVFQPLVEGKVGMYVCGITPYDYAHIGNARPAVVFDTFYRFLKLAEWHVNYVRNFTDIDDKIINKSLETGKSCTEITEKYIDIYHADMDALNVLRPDAEPKISENLPETIELIEKLLENSSAYLLEGDVVFDITKKENYGKLSGKKVEDLQAGARVDVNNKKRNVGDFVLWKAAKKGEPSWSSPWGEGRPGWHIECSAMSSKYLGEHFDIHGGGEDLQFPHHENEIAQSECASGKQYVNYWMHNAFINVGGEKMSKSLGNFTTVHKLLEKYSGEAIRLWILSTHYRKPVDLTEEAMDAAEKQLDKWAQILIADKVDSTEDMQMNAEAYADACQYRDRFCEALADDMNIPQALAEVEAVLTQYKESDCFSKAFAYQVTASFMGECLGLRTLSEPLTAYTERETAKIEALMQHTGFSEDEVDALILERDAARADKNWAESDRIRDELDEMGIILEDSSGNTTWRRK